MAAKQFRRRSCIKGAKKALEFTTRRAQTTDIDSIQALCTESTYKMFGSVDVEDLLHLSYITLLLENDMKEVVGAICVNNYPNVPSIPPWHWQQWLSTKYRMERANPRNTLWVHLAVFERTHKLTFLAPLLQALFAKCPYINFIFFVIPPNITFTKEWLQKQGMEILPIGFTDSKTVQTLSVFLRQHYVVNYKVRKAVAEDNDDLVPLINSHSERVKKLYGEFYIAEIILNKAKRNNRHLVVAEYDGVAVAVLCLNKHLNYAMVNDCFQLVTFYGLKKPHQSDSLRLRMSSLCDVIEDKVSLESFFVYCSEAVLTYETSENEDKEDAVIYDLNKEVDKISLLSEEDEEEEEMEEEEEFVAFRGHANPEISFDALEFTEKQLESFNKKVKRKSITVASDDESEFTFHGSDNAFTLEIAAAVPEHEISLPLLLEASFELFPKRDYCVMSIPSQSYSFPLTSKIFVRAAPKPETDFNQELYVLHHSAISGELFVREAKLSDTEMVKKFLKKVTRGEGVLDNFMEWTESDLEIYKVYVVFCDRRIIGLAILSEVEDLAYIESHYQLATWTDMTKHKLGRRGLLLHFVLSPIFQRHIRWLLLELHRLADYTILFYVIKPKDCELTSSKALACVLGDLIPVIPAKMPEYSNITSSSWNLPEAVGRVERPYAIYISTPVYCGLTRQEINDKIIVVGASDVGIAFLVGLIFQNNPSIRVTFNNIILVSTHGLVPYRSNRFRDIMTPTTGDVSGYYLSLLSLPTYVTVITGVMSAIDRKNKRITVNGSSLPYDMLFLMCGKQYQMPKRSEEKKGKTIERPNNVFIVNTEIDIDQVIKTLKELIEQDVPGHVVVYGYSLDAYCCLEAMIELGIPNSRIYFVLPPPVSEDPYIHHTIFNDSDLEEGVNSHVQKLGIQMYMDYSFVDWTFDDKMFNITSIKFESLTRLLEVECVAVFMYEKKTISTKTFMAITNANLTFDGGLVIDTNCCTNDPNIYAAGTITKYSRRFYADHMKQSYFNRSEIGHKLGQQILDKLLRDSTVMEPTQNVFSHCRTGNKKLVPRYTSPVMVYARLPGKINYMSVRKPGVDIPLDVALNADDYGQVLTSGDCKNLDNQGYFRLHLNHYNTVETITCLTRNELEKVNLAHLWGKHEKLLNNLVTRFEMVTITDLFTFFSEPWSYAIYHDRFDKLNDDINEILTQMTDDEGTSVLEDIIHKLTNNRWKKLTPGQFHKQQGKFHGSEYQKRITEKVLEFLVDNYNYLPMYANPMAANVIMAGYEVSPMFSNI